MSNPHAFIKAGPYADALGSIRRVDADGYLYYMDCRCNYYEPGSPCMAAIDACCSAFTTPNMEGDNLLCRNYDLRHRVGNDEKKDLVTGLNLVLRCENPAAKYKSIGICDLFWLDRKNGMLINGCADDGKTDISALAAAPFVTMDGINEAGFAISILALATEVDWVPIVFEGWQAAAEASGHKALMFDTPGKTPDRKMTKIKKGTLAVNTADKLAWKAERHAVWQKQPGKPTLFHSVLMRRMLDFCATAEEAAAMAKAVNVRSAIETSDYHIILTDRSGKTLVLEWQNNELFILPDVRHLTNFYLCREDRYGGGYDRDEVLDIGLKRYPSKMKEDTAKNILAAASADKDLDPSQTQYSVIYNTNKLCMTVWAWRKYETPYVFSL